MDSQYCKNKWQLVEGITVLNKIKREIKIEKYQKLAMAIKNIDMTCH